MELTRRFVFHGNAAAYGGRIYRPKNVLITGGATSSLTVVGGTSSAKSRGAKFEGFLSVGAATTNAVGGFDNAKQALARTHGKIAEEALTVTTKVSVALERVVIGSQPRLSVGWVGGSMTSSSGAPGDEPALRLVGRDTSIDEVEIDGYPLKITLNKRVFETFDTMSKLQAAASDPAFIDETGDCLFRRDAAVTTVMASPAVVRPPTMLYATLVKELRWAKNPHPTATIDHHSITIPDWGVVFFGEMLITADSRRVTMMRARLGSPTGGDFSCSEYETNGSWFPPMI